MTKYKLTEEFIEVKEVKLFRIELTEKCTHGNIGDKGGFIEKNTNLSGDAWVYADAQVFGHARVYGNAQVFGHARVYGNAQVDGGEWVESPLQIQGSMNFICESKKWFIRIGCKNLPIHIWVKNYKRIGMENGYSESKIKEYGHYIKLFEEKYIVVT